MAKEQSPRQEAKSFVGSGRLRDALSNCGYGLSNEAIDKIVDACCFSLGV